MKLKSSLFVLLLLCLSAPLSMAQDKSSGGLKGKVRVETGTPAGVVVVIRQGEREVTRLTTDKSGTFAIQTLPAGTYSLTFRKPGLSVGTIENIEVKSGKTKSLGDRLVLTIDEGAIAFVRGSVFNPAGKSVPGAKVELLRVQPDGSLKKIDGRVTNETGSFVFRLTPEAAKYRLSVKPNGAEPVSKDVEIDGAAVYRIALSLPPAPPQ